MKKLFRATLCAALLALAVSVPAFAAEQEPPVRQGDFYVLVNGAYVTFPDAVPQIRDDRSCLPFVAVFDQLGFAEQDMTWDGAAGTVTAKKGDLTVVLTIGKNEISITQGDEARVVATDTAPYVDPATNRTYVPFGLVADALGYNVGWDPAKGVVILDDVDAILAANDASYTLMDKYIDYCKTFYAKNQKITGSYAMNMGMDMAAAQESAAFTFDVDGKYEMLTAGATAFQFGTDVTLDLSMKENGADVTDEVLGEDAALFPMALDLDMRGDMADGKFYFQSAALARLMEQPDMANAWYKLDLKAMFDEMSGMLGLDYAALMQLSMAAQDMSFSDYLSVMLKNMPLVSAEYTTTDVLSELNVMMADSAFQKSGSTYVSTLEEDGARVTFTLYTNGSKVNGCAMEAAAADPVFGEMKMDMSMRGSKMKVSMDMDMGAADTGSFTLRMDMDGAYQATSAKPQTAPPADAVIIDLTSGIIGGADGPTGIVTAP